jgi:microcystin-dependent protein
MADPTTSNVLLAVPTRGSDSGTWDVPLNGNASALDGMFGGNATLALSAATTLTLSVPATGTVSAGAGPNQSQNAVLKLTGTLTGNAVINLTLPRIYVFDNQCTVATSYVQIAPASGTGTKVGLPPGQKTRVAFDGTNVDYVGMPLVGSYLEMAVSTTQAWMTACTVQPWLPCDGAIASTSVYSALAALLGSTFGGNGITTFGIPDARNRFSIPVDSSGQGRVTNAISGVDGTVVGSAGGDQRLQQHNHGVTDNGHSHNFLSNGNGVTLLETSAGGGQAFTAGGQGTIAAGVSVQNSTAGISVNNSGTGSSQNIPPVIVIGCKFIKT